MNERTDYTLEPIKSPLRAIRAKCLDCCCYQPNEVKLCPCKDCSLYPFRLGKNPFRTGREFTEEQREAAAKRLAEARKRKEQSHDKDDS